MKHQITRRDFVHGATLATGLAGIGAGRARADAGYPPSKTGMRGSHEGSYEAAHALAREKRENWPVDGEDSTSYDLIVVGGGVSGLSAAYFFRQQKPDARILILDNHDDFGGHAKRNEFVVNGKTIYGYGGSQSMESPAEYSDVSKRLLRELSIDLDRFYDDYDDSFFKRHKLTSGIYFDAKTYGSDQYVPTSDLFSEVMLPVDRSRPTFAESVASMPLDEQARTELTDLLTNGEDRLPDHGLFDLADYLASITYEQFLTKHVGVRSETLLNLLRRLPSGYWGLGTDGVPALEGLLFGLPGVNKLGVPGAKALLGWASGSVEPYIFHYPDGNAMIARLLVRSLIPEMSARANPDELLQEVFDYSLLDKADHNVRVRLNSTAVNVQNTASGVAVTYHGGGRTERVVGAKAVLACYNNIIPYLCTELPEKQKRALAYAVKAPLVYTNVVLNNWRALKSQGVGMAYTPNAFHSYFMVDFPVSIGPYKFSESPDDPIVLHFSEALIQPGLPPMDQHRVGRARLLATPFETIERDVRDTLQGVLAPGGFEHQRDIAAITVNRWPHGYARGQNTALDESFAPGQAPHEIGRQTFGNIAIANSDAGARAYLDEAIDQGYRAVSELTS